MKVSSGFTVVELLMIVVFLGITGTVFFQQQQAVQAVHRDRDRKIAINAIHYNLEEVVRPKLGGYPRSLTATQLTAMDKSLLKDPRGATIGTSASEYRYEPTGCNGGNICKGYVLRADLENETDFIKSSLKS